MKISRRVAFCGVISALSLVWLLMTVFPYGTVAMTALAGLMLVSAALETGSRYGWACFGVTLALSLVLVPDPAAKMGFGLFFGYYPLLQLRIQLWQWPLVKWIVKFAVFNTALVGAYAVAFTLKLLPEPMIFHSPIGLFLIVAPVLNGLFMIYDVVLWRMIGVYRVRIHPIVQRFL